MKADEIIKVLNDFKDSNYERILISGKWGIGKTKYVLDFNESYSNVCYVSLFGKKDTNSVIEEIYFQLLTNKMIKGLTKVRGKLKDFKFSYNGFSLSVPIIKDISKSLYKKLKEKNLIIIFDDLERKHDELNLKEIFGLFDSLSNINGIKTVLIAASEHLDDTNNILSEYSERVFDRTYNIKEYADEAPVRILGEKVWNAIGWIAEGFEFQNLRTFKKVRLFIDEVVQIIGESRYSDNFTQSDLYKMCFATVAFTIEHKSKLVMSNDRDKIDADMVSDGGKIDYLSKYILKNSLKNEMLNSVFVHILNWFRTGTYSKNKIIESIEFINKKKDKPINFFSSEQEVKKKIEDCRQFILTLNGTEKVVDIVSELIRVFEWCEILSEDFGISDEEILNRLQTNISNSVNINNTLYENIISQGQFYYGSGERRGISLIKCINESITLTYYNQLFDKIKIIISNRSYKDFSYLEKLIDTVASTAEVQSIRTFVLNHIKDNKFFFPIPSGKISEEHWTWCHLIKRLIHSFEIQWGEKDYYYDFVNYINKVTDKEDNILQHRIKSLFKIRN